MPLGRPPGGVTAADAVAAYIRGAPGLLSPTRNRIAIKHHRQAPEMTWRRTVPVPPDPRAMLELRDEEVRVLMDTRALRLVYDEVRTAMWRRFAMHRFVADLAAGDLVAWGTDSDAVPLSWWQSDVELDIGRGCLFGLNDRRLPLRSGLRFFAAADAPPEVMRRQAVVSRFGSAQAAVAAAIAEHRDELVGQRRADQLAVLAARLPGVGLATIETSLRRLRVTRRGQEAAD